MFNFFSKKNKDIEVFAPIKGKVVDITEVPDQVFAEKMMGDGVAIEPAEDTIKAPCDGRVALISGTKHAVAIECEGVEILMHIGLDTVELNGEGFEVHVKVDDMVKKGDPLISFDRAFITSKGKPLITPVVIVNMADKVKKLEKHLEDGSKIFTIQVK